MTSAVAPPPPERHKTFQDEPIPQVARDTLNGFALSLAMSNVVMQLSNIKVGYGVAESKVETGRLDKHPIKRGRTTLTFLAVASNGTAAEREYLRKEINRAHRQVHSEPGAAVRYNAFSPDLQLWVAACLYRGSVDLIKALDLPLGREDMAAFYRHSARFATSLQVSPDMWPADLEAFDAYWNEEVKKLEVDDYTRGFLHDLATLGFLPSPVQRLFGPFMLFLTAGFLPQEFRDLLGLKWNRRSQFLLDRYVRLAAAVNRVMPAAAREFPFNVYLWDFRRRMRKGLPVV
ncbi:oxygenase MpaB family protein [Actinocorallia libanotica]|uniref:Oxygenase MpaB family protein n=1 Tax=Actinocorallia libanotica TaxID=46162 RepID=A0ABN1RU06_9ACTN